MSYFLERLVGNSRNEQIPLIGNQMTIGRSVDSSIQLISPMVSRCHAILTLKNNQWIIKDVKSINGIYVNDTKLLAEETCVLTERDVISLGPPGRTEFRYCYCKRTAEVDVTSEDERPRKIKKRERFQSTSDTNTDENVENLGSLEHFLSRESNLNIGAEYPVSYSSNKESASLQSETSNDVKLTLPEADSISNKNVCESLESNVKAVEDSHLISENVHSEENLCPSSNEANSEHLKLTVESLRQLLASKEKEQEELHDKLLRAEAQLIENCYENAKKQENEESSIQEKIKTEVLQQVGDIMETELICGVCTELFVEAVTLNCSHTFCKFCIQKWKQKKKICPICRSSIKTETQALVLDNFIEKMAENLSTEVKEHRKKLIEERRTLSSTSSSYKSNCKEKFIVISDIESEDSYNSDFSDSDFSDSSIEGMPWAYYGGYGRCYTCGRRGHWANGCPDM